MPDCTKRNPQRVLQLRGDNGRDPVREDVEQVDEGERQLVGVSNVCA